jgi:hypothetical protein
MLHQPCTSKNIPGRAGGGAASVLGSASGVRTDALPLLQILGGCNRAVAVAAGALMGWPVLDPNVMMNQQQSVLCIYA